MTAVLSPLAKQQFFDNNGRPLVGGKLFTYIAGTTTKQPTFINSAGITQNANPVILNYRGEADLWVPPNVAFKYVLAPSSDTDPPTNPIWTVDNLVSSQLVTLYGGVDSGVVNAYVLTFTANFTAYTDGIVIYWVASNTNTLASTINVNGLGPVSITNQDGSALTANQIIAGQVITIMYKGGVFLLLSSGIAASVSSGTFAPTWSGFSAAPTGNMAWQVTGRQVTLEWLGTTGTSNANFMTIGNLPLNLRPTSVGGILASTIPTVVVNNGALALGSLGFSGLGVVSFAVGTAPPSTTGFNAAGTKGLDRQWSCTYMLN